MATYNTDLTTLANADDDTVETTWTEMASPYNQGGTPADDDENLIQGTNCQSQTTGTKTGLTLSIVYDNGSGVSWTTGDVFLIWSFYAVKSNLETVANGGLRAVIGASTSAADVYDVGGSDNPYESTWRNVAVDPEKTHDYLIGAGAGTTYRYVGTIPYTLAAISKGTPHAVDAIRYGRGEIYGTGTGATYTGYATENDYNDVTNGYHRWGLFQEVFEDTYLWKGLFSFGQSGTSITFSDSNKTILVDDTPATLSTFNKIEIQNSSSSVTLTNIVFTVLGTNSIGAWENVANATLVKIGCVFNGFGTFEYGSNSTISSIYNACGQITTEGADMSGSSVLESVVTTGTGAVYQDVAYTDTYLDGMTIKSHATVAHPAVSFGTAVTSNLTLRNMELTDFGTTDDANDSTFEFQATSGSFTLSLIDCTVGGAAASSSNISIDDSAGCTVTLSIDPVDINIYVEDEGKVAIANAQVGVFLLDSPFTQLMNEDSAVTTGLATESYGGALPVDIKWRVRKSEDTDNPRYEARSGTGEITSSGFNLTVTLKEQPLPI